MKPCVYCNEEIDSVEGMAQGVIYDEKGESRGAHRECALRMVLGGIGHLMDHNYWCLQEGDPDMGLSYRKSAIEVDAWVSAHGIE